MTPNWKPQRVVEKVRRSIKRKATKSAEDRIMQSVRREDRFCRFPLCGCGRLKLTLDVAHAGEDGHRGIGGNRSLSRTTPANLILICRPRHRAHQFAVDQKTLRVEPLTDAGLRGPVEWWVSLYALPDDLRERLGLQADDVELLLAVETRPHTCLPFTPEQAAILKHLATMTC